MASQSRSERSPAGARQAVSDRRPISDAELAAHIRRRSTDEAAETELWRAQFVAVVRSKNDRDAIPAISRRLPALAGLAGVCALLFLLVVAAPRLAPDLGMGGAPTATPAPPAPLGIVECRIEAPAVALRDFIGEVVSCSVAELGRTNADVPPRVTNAISDPDSLSVRWVGSACAAQIGVDFGATLADYRVFVTERADPCPGERAARELRIHLNRAIPAENVRVVIRDTAPSSQ